MKTMALVCMMAATICFAAGPDPKFPENKWFNGTKGLDEALELQKTFSSDIFLYFTTTYPRDQEGLCKWFEKRGLGQPAVNKYLRDYLKVQIRLPLGKKEEEALSKYNVTKGPTIIIVQPDGKFNYCKVFDWATHEPKLLEPDAMVELFKSKSSAKYQAAPAAAPATAP